MRLLKMPLAAIGQLRSTDSLLDNLEKCKALVRKASEAGAAALFLPEATDYIASNAADTISLAQPVTSSPFVLGLQAEAKKYNLPISVGIHEPTTDGTRVKNTLIWISASGHLTHRYQKLHLFNIQLPNNGPMQRESDRVEPGDTLSDPYPTPVGKVGPMICFDLRFVEQALALRHRGAQVLLYPSAFTVPTGRAHWEVLLRARAVEAQAYVIAAAQVGWHDEAKKRRSYGHGMIVDPWGKVVARLGGVGEDGSEDGLGEGEGEIAVADIDLELVEKVRREMPLLRRTDVYPEIA
ncbi:nitrilase [Corynespora cassiicola Philippines]|uniref:Nitrilase n=1 Tax=Corynespora cassiicola Philippines TaxID=1448308 RepID=A0A2T2P5T4_CORCC|nr:nitrilase [Corynespora cassiicola Philippines]